MAKSKSSQHSDSKKIDPAKGNPNFESEGSKKSPKSKTPSKKAHFENPKDDPA